MDIEHATQAPLILKAGDPIYLRPITATGNAMLQRDGELWIVLRVEACAFATDLDAGVLLAPTKKGANKRWLALANPDVYIERCRN